MAYSKIVTVLVASALFITRSCAYDPTNRECDYICLTSFRWCEDGDRRGNGQSGCTYPENTYASSTRNSFAGPALLFEEVEYTITWNAADVSYPVLIRWDFGGTADQSLYWWSVNTTESEYVFNPSKIIEGFPTEEVDATADEAREAAMDVLNTITVSQPERPEQPNFISPTFDISQQFAVQSQSTVQWIETAAKIAAEDAEKKWKRGVGIGAGVGAPLLIVATAVVVWILAGKKIRVGRSKPKTSDASYDLVQ